MSGTLQPLYRTLKKTIESSVMLAAGAGWWRWEKMDATTALPTGEDGNDDSRTLTNGQRSTKRES